MVGVTNYENVRTYEIEEAAFFLFVLSYIFVVRNYFHIFTFTTQFIPL